MRLTDHLTIIQSMSEETTLPRSTNHIVYSALSTCEHVQKAGGLSIKYVRRGVEHYTIDHCTRSVEAGQYLVVNEGRDFEVCFQDVRPVIGLCLYLDPKLVADVYRTLTTAPDYLLDASTPATPPTFAEYIYHDAEHPLGHLLHHMTQTLTAQPATCFSFSEAVFYEIARQLLDQQRTMQHLMNRLPSSKASTREELLRRLRHAKQFIDDSYRLPITVDVIADVAALSPYHFIRSFKHVYQCSPYQYLREKRMAHAAQLLQRRQHTISAIATHVGFSDIHAFSKAFKQRFGTAPSAYGANC